MEKSVDRLYHQGKAGAWDQVLAAIVADPRLAERAAVHARPSSGWTLLHQAAFWGREDACRALIKRGASPSTACAAGSRPYQAARRRGHEEIAAWLEDLADEADAAAALPCSHKFCEAARRRAASAMCVAYGGGLVRIPAGARYYADASGHVLVGFHGSYDPPLDMDGRAVV